MKEKYAYPSGPRPDPNNPYEAIREQGMTLRDYFAAKAMQGWVASFGPEDGNPNPSSTAELAYEIADAMMTESEKQQREVKS